MRGSSKEAYYFSHDSNARHDEKILAMRSVYNSEGYGWYWMLIEMMRDANAYRLQCTGKYWFNAFAKELDCTVEKFQSFYSDCVNEFNLFRSDGEFFWSDSLIRRMGKRDEKARKATEAANKRWKKEDISSERNADALQPHNVRNARKGKERKKKESVYVSVDTTHTPDDQNQFNEFSSWVSKHAPRVAQMKKPITIDEYFKLKKKLSKEVINKLLNAMENRADLHKKYVSAYLTIMNWSKNEFSNNGKAKTEQTSVNEALKKAGPAIV